MSDARGRSTSSTFSTTSSRSQSRRLFSGSGTKECMALFTGKGDGGTTRVLDSKDRIPKSSELPEALGTLDEVNSFLGLARARARAKEDPLLAGEKISAILRDTQEALFIVQAEVAGGDKRVG